MFLFRGGGLELEVAYQNNNSKEKGYFFIKNYRVSLFLRNRVYTGSF